MNNQLLDKLTDAVLYEGYILYPYRPSNKNTLRWTIGGVFPRSWCAVHATGDSPQLQTECLLEGDDRAALSVRLRFLQLVDRSVWRARHRDARTLGDFERVDSREVAGSRYYPWQEAIEREVTVDAVSASALKSRPLRVPFAFEAAEELERLDDNGGAAGALLRQRRRLEGTIELGAQSVDERTLQIAVLVQNESSGFDAADCSRETAQMQAFVAAHLVLSTVGGSFVSLTNPPERYRAACEQCVNRGAWPVLVGERGATDALLSAPIILYDYPQIAPQSPGDLFDGAEIDEILTLRIMTLTDDEQAQARAIDERARGLLERTQRLGADQLVAMHGMMYPTAQRE